MNRLRLGHASLLLLSGLCAAAVAQPVPLRWQLSALPYPNVYSVAPAQDESGIVYATAADPTTGENGAFRSDDAGVTWSLLVQTLPGDVATAIGVDPHDPAHVIAAAVRNLEGPDPATRLYASDDGGSAWRFVGDYPGACGAEIAFDPTNSNRVYVALGCGAGLLTSDDAGESFSLRDVSLHDLRVGPTSLLYAVGTDALIRSTDGEHWSKVASFPCLDALNVIGPLAVDSMGRLLLSTGCRRMIFVVNPGVFESTDGGTDWRQLSDLALAYLVFDPSRPSNVYASAAAFFGAVNVMGSDDGGRTWRGLALPVYVHQLALSRSGSYLYAATGFGVYRLDMTETRVLPPKPHLVPAR